MSSEIETYLTLLEQRLSLLRLLEREFVDCRKEFVALDLEGMYRHISEQEALCREIGRLDPAIQVLQRTCAIQLGLNRSAAVADGHDAQWEERLAGVMSELEKAQAEVAHLNLIHAAYLRRSRKTIQVLMNLVGSYAMTYARPVESGTRAVAMVEKG